MEEEEISETVIRCARLRDELKPLPIWSAESNEPINPDWVGINHAVWKDAQRSGVAEGYNLAFYRDSGEVLEYLQFDTLEIALDQAKAIAGIQPSEWRECNVSVSNDGQVPWESAA
jgi:hypothetical protein